MPKKLSYEYVEKEFEKEEYVLLTTEYKNAFQKLECVCPNGHNWSTTWNIWQQRHRCCYCSGKMKKTINFIKREFEKEGYILLTNKYKNAHQKLNYICPNGHKHNITWSDWNNGHRCYYCAINKVGNTQRLCIEFVKLEFEKENYILLAKDYENCEQKLEYICPSGHKHSISWNNWRAGRRCGVCKMFRGQRHQHGCWKGGISKEPYCPDWTKDLKESIKQRDGYRCLNPDCWGTTRRLTVHHIDYNKKNCNPKNLITLCNSCNIRANKNRNWHKAWYQSIMYMRYEYRI